MIQITDGLYLKDGVVHVDDSPRRCRIDRYAPAEIAIFDAMHSVEKLPADPALTEAVTALSNALRLTSDYVDKTLIKELNLQEKL